MRASGPTLHTCEVLVCPPARDEASVVVRFRSMVKLGGNSNRASGAEEAAAVTLDSAPPPHGSTSAAGASVDVGAKLPGGAVGVSGLRLLEGVIDTSGSPSKHDVLVAWVRETLERGRAGELPGNTYAPVPDKWKERNQSREMLQFGTYTHSNRVETHVPVAALPPELTSVVDELVARGAITEAERFDSCTINLYGAGQWIPPHIDNPAFARPFCTVSLCSQQPMVLGRGMVWPEGSDPNDPDAWTPRSGEEATLELPVGSVVVVSGDAADVYEHAIPPVSQERISLTFRRVMPPGEALQVQIERTERCRREYRDKRKAVAAAVHKSDIAKEYVRRGSGVPKAVAEKAARDAEGEAPEAVPMSKNQAKKNAKKAARAAAKERHRKEKLLVTSVDGSEFEKKEKKRSCPPCPVHLLPMQDDEDSTSDASRTHNTCDELRDELSEKVTEAEALPFVERRHVMDVYDAVAQQWHGTRYRAWSGVEDFIRRRVYPGSLVADVGCGNGKNMPPVEAQGGFAIGMDFSVGLLDICHGERGLEVFAGDAVCLSLRSGAFDVALNIAVLHHISSLGRRRKLVAETMRLVRPGGVALFYAWALEQESGVSGHHFESQDVLVPFHKKAGVGGVGGEGGDTRVRREGKARGDAEDAKKEAGAAVGSSCGHPSSDPEASKVYQRYCHVYKDGELAALFKHLSGWVKVTASYFDCGNWCVEAERIK